MTPARGAGRPRAALAKVIKSENAIRRRELGTLSDLRVAPTTLKRYQAALNGFFSWLVAEGRSLPRQADALDIIAAAYIEHLWQEGDGRNRACDTLSGIQHAVPAFKGQLRLSWELTKSWSRHELPARAPPLPPVALFALAEVGCRLGLQRCAVTALVAAHCMLRTGECLQLLSAKIA